VLTVHALVPPLSIPSLCPSDEVGFPVMPINQADHPLMRRAFAILERMTNAQRQVELERWESLYG
jgi:hypothetical protein